MSGARTLRHVGPFALAALLLSLAAAASGWQPPAPAPAAARGVDLAAFDGEFDRALRDWRVPGMAVAIVKDGRVLLAKGYGVREHGRPEAVDERTLFAIASNTKAFTAAAVAALVDRGRLGWDDPVAMHVPSFRLRDPLASADIRVRDLLCHRSGLGTFSGDLLWYGTTYDRAEVVRRARFLEPAAPFRARYGYQNVMYIAAGEVVAAAARQPWDAFVREHFLEPLGMRDTVTSTRDLAGRTNVATPHAEVDGALRTFPWANWDSAAAAGGIISSAGDMARWMLLQLARGELDGRLYFTESASTVMWTPHVSMPVDRESRARTPSTHFRGYGLGWSLRDYQGRMLAEHGGAYDGMLSRVVLVPEEQLGVVILTNGATGIGDALAYRVVDAFLGAAPRDWSREGLERAARAAAETRADRERRAKARQPGTSPSLALAQYAGTYAGDLYGAATVAVEDGRLVLRLDPAPEFVADLDHWHFDTFRIRWRRAFPWFGEGLAQFVLDHAGAPVELRLDVPNDDFWFHELELRRRP